MNEYLVDQDALSHSFERLQTNIPFELDFNCRAIAEGQLSQICAYCDIPNFCIEQLLNHSNFHPYEFYVNAVLSELKESSSNSDRQKQYEKLKRVLNGKHPGVKIHVLWATLPNLGVLTYLNIRDKEKIFHLMKQPNLQGPVSKAVKCVDELTKNFLWPYVYVPNFFSEEDNSLEFERFDLKTAEKLSCSKSGTTRNEIDGLLGNDIFKTVNDNASVFKEEEDTTDWLYQTELIYLLLIKFPNHELGLSGYGEHTVLGYVGQAKNFIDRWLDNGGSHLNAIKKFLKACKDKTPDRIPDGYNCLLADSMLAYATIMKYPTGLFIVDSTNRRWYGNGKQKHFQIEQQRSIKNGKDKNKREAADCTLSNLETWWKKEYGLTGKFGMNER